MLKRHDRSLRGLLLATDVGLAAIGFALLPVLHSDFLTSPEPMGWRLSLLALAAAFALPISIRILDADPSTRLESFGTLIRRVLMAAGVAVVVLAAAAFLIDAPVAPLGLAVCVILQTLLVGFVRLTILKGLRAARRRGRNYRNVLIVGSGPRASELTQTIRRHPEWGLKLIGYVDDGDMPPDPDIPASRVHKLIEFPELIRDNVIDEVIAACPRSMLATIAPVLQGCAAAGVPLTVMTDLFGDYMPPPRIKQLASRGVLTFAPVHHSASMLALKRSLDILGAIFGLAVAAPLIGIAALAIKATSPGPIFFRQIRCGLYGRPFPMLKLRTMVMDAEARQAEFSHLNEMDGPVFKIVDDPRITAVGKLLRAFSVDELPQFYNVLMGDMSLVGPRPPIPAEVAQYETSDRRRLSMRPGLTCIWQVSGRNAIDFEEWVRLDLEYIDTWSLTNDLKILAQTIPTVVGGTGS